MSASLSIAALALALTAAPLLAQDPGEEDSLENSIPEEGPPGNGNPEGAPAPSKPISLADARVNIVSIIEAFIAQRSPHGFWPLRDKKTRRMRHLKLLAIDDRHVHADGGALYTAPASLKDTTSGATLAALFTVDFTGPNWQVVRMRMPAP